MRLRHVLLTFGALAAAWIGLATHRADEHIESPRPAVEQKQGPDEPAQAPRPTEPRAQLKIQPAPRVRARARRPITSGPAQLGRSTRSVPWAARKRASFAAATTAVKSTRLATEEPPAPIEPPTIVAAEAVEVTSSTARISWRTNVPTRGQAAFGFDVPTIWAERDGESTIEHESVLAGLEPSTTYQVYLDAHDDEQRVAASGLALTTGPPPDASAARTDGDRIVVDDRPFFGRAVWKQCSDGLAGNIDDGINLFIGDGCSRNDRELPHRLDGRAYSLLSADDADVPGRGVIGWYYTDEWDAFLASTVERRDLAHAIVPPREGRVGFLTLTNHFYSHAEPLPQGKGMYPLLFTIPDVIGFDLYPLQGWCRPAFGDVFDAQRELSSASGGKPTFQWIEVGRMEQVCGTIPALDPTPATVRAETWLAVAGGADSIGYFPNRWSPSMGAEIRQINDEIEALAPALLAEPVDASCDNDAVRVSARTLNGALYVIAVNTSVATVRTKISIEGIAGRSATVFGRGDSSTIAAEDGGFFDSFAPLAVRIYVIAPRGW
jgi:hypothetical protein